MTNEEIDKLWHKALNNAVEKGDAFTRYEFATLIEQHLIKSGYRKCAEGQRVTQHCAMVDEAVREEREACAKVCEEVIRDLYIMDGDASDEVFRCAKTIRARGEE